MKWCFIVFSVHFSWKLSTFLPNLGRHVFQWAYVGTIIWFFFVLYHYFSPACAVGVTPGTRYPAQDQWTAPAFSAKTMSPATSTLTGASANTVTEKWRTRSRQSRCLKADTIVSNFEVENIVTIHMKLKFLCSAQHQVVFIYSFMDLIYLKSPADLQQLFPDFQRVVLLCEKWWEWRPTATGCSWT